MTAGPANGSSEPSPRRWPANISPAARWRGRSASLELVNRSCLIDRQGFRLILGPPRDHRRVDIEGCGDHRGRRVRQPGTFEYLEELQFGVAEILDIMAIVALDVADVARVEVRGLRFGTS